MYFDDNEKKLLMGVSLTKRLCHERENGEENSFPI
jgi:hypothetical protein